MFERVQFQIDGMGCGACVVKVKGALARLPGVVVEDVQVGSAQVRRDPAQASDEVITQALSAEGYFARKEASHAPASCCGVGSVCTH